MKRQTKHIKTKKIQELERLDKAVWLIPPVVCIFMLRGGFGNLVKQFQEDFVVGLIALAGFIIILGIFYIPLMMLWRAVSRSLKQSAIEQTTFPVLENFDYFRDELTGISPATISMCVDYEIERDKDLAAQLLKFTMQGLIETDGEQIRVLHNLDTTKGLSVSEQFLLSQLVKGNVTESVAEKWASIARKEVLDGPYIIENKEQKETKSTGPIGCLPFFVIMGICVYFLDSEYVTLLMELSETDMSNAELFSLMSQDSRYAIGAAGIMGMGILVFSSMMFPFSRTLFEYINWKKRMPYKRSEEGEILAEEIYGLKNFIHDFSDLEHAQKEALVLWDDFLIYAVLLEENTSIVEEIKSMRNC